MLLILPAWLIGCQPAPTESVTHQEEAEIAQTVGDRFGEVATATSNLEFDRLLDLYQNSEALTYVARGEITRSHEAFSEIFDAQFGRVTGAALEFSNRHVDVLSRDVVVVTANYQFTAALDTGDTGSSSGTFTCIFVNRDGVWEIQHSSHTFPASG
jgi:hypothetical protein